MTINTLKKIPVTFVSSPKLLANYYCFLAKHVQNGFYQKQNFIVLPYLSNCFQSVYFPKLNLSGAFWKAIAACTHSNITRLFPKKAIDETETQLEIIKPNNTTWNFSGIPVQLENEFKQIKSITILPTHFGTKSSFYYTKKSGGIDVFMTIRDDQPPDTISWSLINILLLMKDPEFAYKKFPERRAIVEFLINSKGERNPKSQELLNSKTYLEKLGFGQKSYLKTVNGEILIGGKLARLRLSINELKLLNFLNLNRGKTVSHDQIFEEIWGTGEFSLWAITQLVHRLKTKIKKLGINEEIILSLKNQGYLLP